MKVKISLLLLLVVLGLYFITGDYGPAPDSDENIYYYMAKEVSQGSVPYRDFFFAHPPLMIMPQALLFWLFSPHYLLGRLIPILAGAATLVLTYLIGNEIQKGSGIYATIVVLSSYSFQLTHARGIGLSLSVALILGSIYLSLKKNDLWAGALLGLSAFVRLSNFPVFVVLAGYHFWRKRWRFLAGLGILAGFLLLALIPNFVQDVFLYHVLKSALSDKAGIIKFVANEWILISLAGLAAFSKFNAQKFLILGCALSGALLLLLSQVFIFYLAFLVPFIALLAGFGIMELAERKESLKPAVIAVFLILLCYNSYAYRVESLGDEPGLKNVFEEISGPVFDLSASFGAHYAIMYDARISGKLIDMYHARVASGLIDWDETLQRLEGDPPKYIFDKRREFTDYNWREEWKKTPLKEFVYEKYVPVRFVEMSKTQEVVIVWGQKKIGPGIDFTGNFGEYYVEYYTGEVKEDEVELISGELAREANPQEVVGPEEFIAYLEEHTVRPEVAVDGAWNVSRIGEGAHWIVEDGLVSETWVDEYQGDYILFTETRDQDRALAFVVQVYRPGQGVISRGVYQNLKGGFIKVYEERLV